jgi:hypothetical protein
MASRLSVIPPGGFAGFATMTPTSRASLLQGAGKPIKPFAKGPKRRRGPAKKKKKLSMYRVKKARIYSKRTGKALKKGSKAAKAYMAKLRKMRKKKA